MTGHGGWPMTVFVDHDGRPFHCGTYFPPDRRGGMPGFIELLRAVDDVWRNRRDDLLEQAAHLTEHLQRSSLPSSERTAASRAARCSTRPLRGLLAAHDGADGGFGRAPKFPQSMSLDLLLRSGLRRPPSAAATTSLDAMASGGMYDHLGGGFARYSVDGVWLVPHFEKMLYDQALLGRAYLHGWQVTGSAAAPAGARRARWATCCATCATPTAASSPPRTPTARARRACSTRGRPAELAEVLGTERRRRGRRPGGASATAATSRAARSSTASTPGASWPGRRRSRRPGRPLFEAAGEAGAAGPRRQGPHRVERPDDRHPGRGRPGLRPARTGPTPRWPPASSSCGSSGATTAAGCARGRHGTGARRLAFAADHAALVDAFTRLAEATGEARWLAAATEAADALLDLFWDDEKGGVFTTGHDGEALVARQKDLLDNATPSANSIDRRGAPAASARSPARTASRPTPPTDPPPARPGRRPAPDGPRPPARRRRPGRRRHDEIVVTGDRPDLLAAVRRRGGPGPSWPGASARRRRCGRAAPTRRPRLRLPRQRLRRPRLDPRRPPRPPQPVLRRARPGGHLKRRRTPGVALGRRTVSRRPGRSGPARSGGCGRCRGRRGPCRSGRPSSGGGRRRWRSGCAARGR